MQVHLVRPLLKKKDRIRRGRGDGSKGTYSGRGLKGQKARSGGGVRPGFEGGQNPQIKGLPMLRGFTNPFRVEYQVVNVGRLQTLPEGVAEVTPSVLAQMRIVHHADRPVKVLGVGELTRALTVEAKKFSATARAKIEAAGGTVKEG
ncbi:MAG: 50S ribosomal protein L15 [Chloroflexi bacterium]|nr:50S ribosomal protein L15 [Chloroflexota bacterium]